MGQGPGLGIDVLMQLTAGDRAVVFIVLVLGLALKALILWWLYVDTIARGRRPLWWLVAAFLLDVPTLIVWLIVRPPHPEEAMASTRPQSRSPSQSSGRPQEPFPHGEDPYGQDPRDPMQPPFRPTPQPPLAGDSGGAGEEEPDGKDVHLTCPQCGTRFHARRGEGPRRVSCPECGRGGTLPGRAP